MLSNLSLCQPQMILLIAALTLALIATMIRLGMQSQQTLMNTFSKSTMQTFIVLNHSDGTIRCTTHSQYLNEPVCFSADGWYAGRCITARSSEEAIWQAAQEDFSEDLQFAAALLEAHLVEKDWLVEESEVENIEALDRRCAQVTGSSIFSRMIKLINTTGDVMWVDEAAFHRNPQTWGREWIEGSTIVQDSTTSEQMKLNFAV